MQMIDGRLTQHGDDRIELQLVARSFSWLSVPGVLFALFVLAGHVCLFGLIFFLVWGTWECFAVNEWLFGSVLAVSAAAVVFGFGYLILRGVCSSGEWFHFDRQHGQIVRLRRPLGFWRHPQPVESWMLADFSAIRLRYAGTRDLRHTQYNLYGQGESASWTTTHHVYEFGLVFHDELRAAAVLVTSNEWEWMRDVAPRIGEFIQRPVRDELHHGDSGNATG